MARNQGQRMLKRAGRGQFALRHRANIGGEGLGCPLCSPHPWGRANKREAQEQAALEAIEELAQEQEEIVDELRHFFDDGQGEEWLITIDGRVEYDDGFWTDPFPEYV